MDCFIPSKILIGFRNRSDTYLGKLAFITYKNQQGEIANSHNFKSWIDSSIPTIEVDNCPRNSFIINKSVNHSSSYYFSESKIRIFDSREFEIEITLGNFLYVARHSNISKMEITQDCVYGFNNNQIVLIPINSEEYAKSMEHSTTVLTPLEHTIGNSCQDNKQNHYTFLGEQSIRFLQQNKKQSKKGKLVLNNHSYLKIFSGNLLSSNHTPLLSTTESNELVNNINKISDFIKTSKVSESTLEDCLLQNKQALHSFFKHNTLRNCGYIDPSYLNETFTIFLDKSSFSILPKFNIKENVFEINIFFNIFKLYSDNYHYSSIDAQKPFFSFTHSAELKDFDSLIEILKDNIENFNQHKLSTLNNKQAVLFSMFFHDLIDRKITYINELSQQLP
jgi:hypothetical protein